MLDWLKDTIAKVVALALDTVTSVIKWIAKLFENIFEAAWNMLKDMFCWALENLLDIVIAAVKTLNVDNFKSYVPGSDLPPEIINVMSLCSVGSAVGIITAAIGVRLVLQVIPFTRFGS